MDLKNVSSKIIMFFIYNFWNLDFLSQTKGCAQTQFVHDRSFFFTKQ